MNIAVLKERHRVALGLLIVLLCGVWGIRSAQVVHPSYHGADILKGDPIDTPYIIAGLERSPSFQDTLSWWHGTWIQGEEIPFYRPLTSLAWWGQYQIFGRYGLFGFMAVLALSHLLVVFLMFLLLRELLGLRIATLSAGLFALHATLTPFLLPSGLWALIHWKDNPEPWCSAAYIVSLWCFLRLVRGAPSRFLVFSLLAFFVAICFKEMAYTLPFMLLGLLWYEKKLVTHGRFTAPFFALAALMFAFRFWALGGMGFRFGTNGSWLSRWLMNLFGGAPMAEMTRGYFWPFVIASLFAALLWFLSGRSRVGVLGLSGAAGFALLLIYRNSQDMSDPFYYQILGSAMPWINAVYTLAALFLAWRFVRNRERGQIFGWLWALITYIPLMTAPITQHALYLVAIGWSIWLAYTLEDLWRIISVRIIGGISKRLSSPVLAEEVAAS